MRSVARFLTVAGATAFLAGATVAQFEQNDWNRSNGANVVFIYSSPSVGFSTGTNPPDINGDLFWGSWGQNASQELVSSSGTIEVDGIFQSLFDTSWAQLPDGTPVAAGTPGTGLFYDQILGPAYGPLASLSGGYEPHFFLDGGFTTTTTAFGFPDVLISLGSAPFGGPCTVAAGLCVNLTNSCPPAGFVNGYVVDIGLGTTGGAAGTGVIIGASTSAGALTYFVPGGFTATGGSCGLGKYPLQDLTSTSETQASSVASGNSPYGGFRLGNSVGPPVADALTDAREGCLEFKKPVVNMVASTDGVLVEDDSFLASGSAVSNGGALNAVNLSTGGGSATIGAELRDLAGATAGDLGIILMSLTALPPPGVPLFGDALLVLPPGVFIWGPGPIAATAPIFTSEGQFIGGQIPTGDFSAVPGGVALHTQGAGITIGPPGVGVSIRTTARTQTTLR